MLQNNFKRICIDTLKNLRLIVSTFPQNTGSVAVVSQSRIHHQYIKWVRHLPRVSPYYAVKCNPEPILLQTLSNHFVNFDCASLKEVYDVKNVICPYDHVGSDIIYAHPMKSDNDICVVDKLGIQTTVVDSLEECDKLKMCGWRGSAYLRVAVNDSGSKMPFSVKFGASEKEVEDIARLSNIPISGVSFHVGSGCNDPMQYTRAIEYASGTVFNILRKYAHNPKVIDIGGGFSGNISEFLPAADAINSAINKIPKGRIIIAEPGRYFAQPSQDLFVKVIAKKRGVGGRGWRYAIDESLYSHFSCIPFDHQTPPWIRVPNSICDSERPKEYGTLFGRTCDSLDVIAKGNMECLEVGDWLYFPLMGAYTSATASEFNGFPKPYVMNDLLNLLPNVDTAYNLVKDIHSNSQLTYSNSLVPLNSNDVAVP